MSVNTSAGSNRDALSEGRTSAALSRQQSILRTAAELFDDKGFFQTSMDDVAAAVNLKKPSLYHYFRSKDELLYWIHDEFITTLEQRMLRRKETVTEPAALLQGVMSDLISLIATHHLRTFFENLRDLSPDYQAEIAAKREKYAIEVRELVEAVVPAGRSQDEVAVLTLGFLGTCNWAYQWYRTGLRGMRSPVIGDQERIDSMSADEIAAILWRAWMAGLTAPA